ncbi:peptide chain release factor 1 [Candidatus Termititenax aidoneus]|uniref:Peptide chain release factor 1 n=1 Tax=Termititenax aidoneus TaxID=2218524 RepID=A0A388T8P0_TERA1|nr:peptide chain release factor 1 [Candidatus Termititenax aidoneus]
MMLDKIEEIVKRYRDNELALYDPQITADLKRYRELMRAQAEMKDIVEKYQEYKKTRQAVDDARSIMDDAAADKEIRELAESEWKTSAERLAVLEEELKFLLVPKDPDDNKNAILEIRQGTGGEEAALFASDLFSMYRRYAERNGWRFQVISLTEAEQGGFKEVIVEIGGEGIYGKMKYESGVHRVQRVPETEAQGRVHTSAATVAIMPEVEDVDIEINPADLKIDTYRSSGAGGQHINKTDSAVRITHLPTGVVVSCQDGRSQHANRDSAMRVLRSRIYEMQARERQQKEKDLRKMQVGSGDRSEKVRTYNYPQNRITDHRIGLTLYNLDAIVKGGDLSEITNALIQADRIAKLQAA